MIKSINKINILIIFIVLVLGIFTSCSNSNHTSNTATATISKNTSTAANTSTAEIRSDTDDKTEWKTAYKNHLASYIPEMGFITLGLADFNDDKQPELIILDDSLGTLGGIYIIVSYQNGEAVEICRYGISSSITEVNEQFYFYRDFDSIHSSGGMFGYGFVSKLDCKNGIFSISNLLESSIDYNFSADLDELSWQLEGEVNVLKSIDFKNYLTIQKWANSDWQHISADEYILFKNTCLGANPFPKQLTDYFKNELDFFDSSYNTYPITQDKLDELFNEWGK